MARALRYKHGFGSQCKECVRRGADKPRVCGHLGAGNVLHQIRLQQNGPSLEFEPEQTESFKYCPVEREPIGIRVKERYPRAGRAQVPDFARCPQSLHCERSGSAQERGPESPAIYLMIHMLESAT